MSTSPTLISWRRKSSVRKLSSANLISVRRAAACPCSDASCYIVFRVRICSDSPQPKPVKLIRPHRQQVRQVAHPGKYVLARHLDQNISLVVPQIQFDSLRGARKIVDHQDRLVSQSPHIGQYSVTGWIEKLNRSPAEDRGRSPDRYGAPHPVEERVFSFGLPQDVHCRIAIYRVIDKRRIQTLRVRGRKAPVPSPAPLHRSPYSVSVT